MSDSNVERIKLSAAFLNALAVAFVTLGGVTPLVSYFYGLSPIAVAVGPGTLIAGVVIWTSCGIVLHCLGRSILSNLDP